MLLPTSMVQAEGNLVRIATGEWVPYVSQSYPHHGALAHIIEKIYAREGMRVEFSYLPWTRGYETNFRLLNRGIIDLFPQDKHVGYAMIRRLFGKDRAQDFTHSSKPIHTQSLHLIFARSNPQSQELLHKFNQGLEKMRRSGELQGYLNAMRDGLYEAGYSYEPGK